MTAKQLEQEVWELIDEHCLEMSQREYLDFLIGLRDDAAIRAESVENEIQDEDDEF